MDVSVSFNRESDGFMSQECPACSGRFKIKFGEGSPEPISFCPYCCHMGRDCWWTPEQAVYMKEVMEDAASDFAAKELQKITKGFNRKAGGGLLGMSMSVKQGRKNNASPPEEPESEMPVYNFGCCGEAIFWTNNSIT